jgi:hypothetical protein
MKKLQDIIVDCADKLNHAEQEYHFQPTLTEKLDNRKGDLRLNDLGRTSIESSHT